MQEIVIIDTDILIDAGRGIDRAIQCLKQQESSHKLAISIITQMELIIGCRNKRELQMLEHFLHHFVILKINETISETGVELLRQYRLSHGLLIADALIAATAIRHGALLISKNQRDYRFIDGLQLLDYSGECGV